MTRRYDDILSRVRASAGRGGIRWETLGAVHHSSPYEIVRLTVGPGAPRICLAAGIHGDEPAGVEALVRFVEGLASQDGKLPYGLSFRVFPCNNPSGYERGTRENAAGIDLNREFGVEDQPEEVVLVQKGIKGESFDLFVDFHEDTDGEGVYLYEICRTKDSRCRPVGRRIIEVLSSRWPVDRRERIDGHLNCEGVICPEGLSDGSGLRRHGLPLPVYLYFRGVGHCMTLETPTRLPFEDRVQIHLEGLETILSLIA
ncbi:MAG: M14 family metallocarboxypeptidase [Nitrospirae bacterium]|nr:M14 family metallocarboxypeptidase [Nitrospirota bacterium]